MSPTVIAAKTTVFDVTEAFPATIEVFVEAGFPRMRDADKRRVQGKALTVEAAARLRKMETTALLDKLRAAADKERAGSDVTLNQSQDVELLPDGDVRISGLLPCPVRLPLLESVASLSDQLRDELGVKLGWSLAAASVGADGLTAQLEAVTGTEDLPELFISAGFESFFDQRALARFKDRGVFTDLAPAGQNACFGDLQLRDPQGHFTMLGVVPAVFLVNGPALGDTPAPRTWDDLLQPELAGRVALPVGDFDLFNGMLLTLHQRFGDDGIHRLGRAMQSALHPSQTVGRFAGRSQEQPAVSIVPHFFSRMTMGSQAIRVVWPEDGAIICPIFMLAKNPVSEGAAQVAELLLSEQTGEILAHRGLFPVLNPEVDNRLPEGAGFQWLGWDFIRENDIGELIPRLNDLFQQATGETP